MRSPFLLLWFPSLATYEPRAKDHMPQPFLKLALDIRFHACSVMSDSLRSHRPEPTWLLFDNSFQAWILEWVAISSSADLPNPGVEPVSPSLAGGCFTTEPPGNPEPKIKFCLVEHKLLLHYDLKRERVLSPLCYPSLPAKMYCQQL